MNKLNKTAYMLFIWAFVCLSAGGCAAKSSASMYLEAKEQTEETRTDKENAGQDALDGQTVFDDNGESDEKTDSGICFVYVCGAVNQPGVFELAKGSRVYEAIALAGGLRGDAYSKGINQAEQIQDGDMIEVLTKKEHARLCEQTGETGLCEQTGEAAMHRKEPQDGLIDINTASEAELMTLNGIGQAKAANIIAYRESSGGFGAPEEIMNVSGIGEGVYAKIQDKIKVIR